MWISFLYVAPGGPEGVSNYHVLCLGRFGNTAESTEVRGVVAGYRQGQKPARWPCEVRGCQKVWFNIQGPRTAFMGPGTGGWLQCSPTIRVMLSRGNGESPVVAMNTALGIAY